MSILSVVRDVCLAIGVNPPMSMFSPIGAAAHTERVAVARQRDGAAHCLRHARVGTAQGGRHVYRRRRDHAATAGPDRCACRHDHVRPSRQLQAHAADSECLAIVKHDNADGVRSRRRRVAQQAGARLDQRLGRVVDLGRADAHRSGDVHRRERDIRLPRQELHCAWQRRLPAIRS